MPAELRLSPSGPPRLAGGDYDYSVLNLTALAAVPASKPSLYWVWSLLCYWKRNPTSTLVPDGITVIAAVGGGNWERIVDTTAVTGCQKDSGSLTQSPATMRQPVQRLALLFAPWKKSAGVFRLVPFSRILSSSMRLEPLSAHHSR